MFSALLAFGCGRSTGDVVFVSVLLRQFSLTDRWVSRNLSGKTKTKSYVFALPGPSQRTPLRGVRNGEISLEGYGDMVLVGVLSGSFLSLTKEACPGKQKQKGFDFLTSGFLTACLIVGRLLFSSWADSSH
jgi:hypothetical protein